MDMNHLSSRIRPPSSLQKAVAHEAAEYCMSHTDRHVTIPELARTFHISPTHLKSAFQAVFGTSLYRYIRGSKMQWAARQLTETRMPILAIANSCGYENASKFSHAFRLHWGTSPIQYRKGFRSSDN